MSAQSDGDKIVLGGKGGNQYRCSSNVCSSISPCSWSTSRAAGSSAAVPASDRGDAADPGDLADAGDFAGDLGDVAPCAAGSTIVIENRFKGPIQNAGRKRLCGLTRMLCWRKNLPFHFPSCSAKTSRVEAGKKPWMLHCMEARVPLWNTTAASPGPNRCGVNLIEC